MIEFILNENTIRTDLPPGTTLLDFVRYQNQLTGTKIGCREGDCGACTMLIGQNKNGKMNYMSATSCITPIGNVHGKHVVSIEGLNMPNLSPVQEAMVEESASQCGFCTPGFVVSLTGSCFAEKKLNKDEVIACIDGNICRCTGYKSIERAAKKIHSNLNALNVQGNVSELIQHAYIPEYFGDIQNRLSKIASAATHIGNVIVGGGTDLYVQKHFETEEADIHFVSSDSSNNAISLQDNTVVVGGACTVSDLMQSPVMVEAFPKLQKHLKLVSSTPIRNIATIAGNFVNASPIGDLTAFFLALDASVLLVNKNGNVRVVDLKSFYLGYKVIDKLVDEIISEVRFVRPDENTHFNFEKVSKRMYLDIASVNTALMLKLSDEKISDIHISAGGVGPTPIYLSATANFLRGKKPTPEVIIQAQQIAQKEIAPISDARGQAAYKRLLLDRLLLAHFVELFPTIFNEEALS